MVPNEEERTFEKYPKRKRGTYGKQTKTGHEPPHAETAREKKTSKYVLLLLLLLCVLLLLCSVEIKEANSVCGGAPKTLPERFQWVLCSGQHLGLGENATDGVLWGRRRISEVWVWMMCF